MADPTIGMFIGDKEIERRKQRRRPVEGATRMGEQIEEPLEDFWYLNDPPTQTCGRCGKVMPWSYWDRNCNDCNDAYFAAVREAEGRRRS